MRSDDCILLSFDYDGKNDLLWWFHINRLISTDNVFFNGPGHRDVVLQHYDGSIFNECFMCYEGNAK